MPECPEAARVHYDWATNPEMRPEQASCSAIDFATLHNRRQSDLLREAGEVLVEHRVLKNEQSSVSMMN